MTREEADAAVAAAWTMPVPTLGTSREETHARWVAQHQRWTALAAAYDALLPHLEIGSGVYYAVIQAVGEAEERRDHAAESARQCAERLGVSV